MNVPIPAGPDGRSGGVSGPAESSAPDAADADLDDGMGSSVSGEPPGAIPDDEYEPL
jgi:hypothetical protein